MATPLETLWAKVTPKWKAGNPNLSNLFQEIIREIEVLNKNELTLLDSLVRLTKRVDELTPLPTPTPTPTPSLSKFPWLLFDTPIPADAKIDVDSANAIKNLDSGKGRMMVLCHDYGTTIKYEPVGNTTTIDVKGRDWAHKNKWLRKIPFDHSWAASPGTDKHLCIVGLDGCQYDFWGFVKHADGTFSSGTMNTAIPGGCNGFRPNGQGQRSGQNVLTAGTILKSEAEAGLIPHALAFACGNRIEGEAATFPCAIEPGSSIARKPGFIPEGVRIRLNTSVDIDRYARNPSEKAVLIALRDYGAFCVDRGGFGFVAENGIKWRDFPAGGSWFLPKELMAVGMLELLEYGHIGKHFHADEFNQSENCPNHPIT